MRNQLEMAYELSVEHNEKVKNKSLQLQNKNKYLRKLKVGDQVLILLPTGSGNNTQWKGPYEITKQITKVTYKIDVNGTNKNFHINNLRLYKVNSEKINVEYEKQNDQVEIFNCLYSLQNKQNSEIDNIQLDHIENEEVKSKLKQILKVNSDIITEKPGLTNCIEHNIELTDRTEFRAKTYRVPQMLITEVDKELDNLLESKIIEKSNSQYSSPMVIVKKKDGNIRLCCDYRQLNKVTKIDQEGLPNIESIIADMSKGKIFTTIDLTRGFWQVPLNKHAKQFCAFRTHRGIFEWTVMPFGLINSTATFTKMMRKILPPKQNRVHYVDDICIYTETWEEHIKELEEVLEILRQNNLTVSPKKIKIGQKEIEFLGHKFYNGNIKPTEQFQRKMLDIKVPKTKKQVRSILGLFNYYSKFIDKYTEIVRPIIDLTKKNAPNPVKWTKECQNAYTQLIEAFSKDPILVTINKDDKLFLATDASKAGIAACLMKEVEVENIGKVKKPAYYISRSLSKSEKAFSIFELEGLAICWAVLKFQWYLLGRKFIILTDHRPLINFNLTNVNNKRINKYAMKLADYQFTIQSIRGKENFIPDILSRHANSIPDKDKDDEQTQKSNE